MNPFIDGDYQNPGQSSNASTNDWTKWYEANNGADSALGWADQATFGGAFIPTTRGTHWIGNNNNNVPWISPGSNAKLPNGYYAYKYNLNTSGLLGDSAGGLLSGVLNLTYASDDYLAAIYLNGQRIYGIDYDKFLLTEGQEQQYKEVQQFATFANVLLNNGNNDFVFLVHNTNIAGTATSDNATGIALFGEFDAELTPTGTTPEPATMLIIGLGLAGLGLARRRKNK